ncbi:MAG: HAD-IA family hydrolase [Burkholderiales bacterium]
MKLNKPDPALFVLAARRLGVAREDCLLIDDRLENVQSARATGWQALRFSTAQTLAEDLKTLGIAES